MTHGGSRGVMLSVLLALVPACGGGGGGGGGGGSTTTFSLDRGAFGRLIEDDSGARVLSPLTTVERDPETGLVLPDSVLPLGPGIDDLTQLAPLDDEHPTV